MLLYLVARSPLYLLRGLGEATNPGPRCGFDDPEGDGFFDDEFDHMSDSYGAVPGPSLMSSYRRS